jgi:hypothetical protein
LEKTEDEDRATYLGRVLSDTITGVDDGYGRELGSVLGRSDLGVSDDDGIGIAAEGSDGVGERLSLPDGRRVGVDDGDVSSQSLHRRLERGRRPRRGLVEERREHSSLEEVESTVPLDLSPHLGREVEDVVEILSGVLLDGKDVSAVEGGVRLER